MKTPALIALSLIIITVLGCKMGSKTTANGNRSANRSEAANTPGTETGVEKVKPAVIAVRVKIEDTDATTGSGPRVEQFGDNEGLQQFFRQFGMPDGRNFQMPKRGPRTVIWG